MSKNSGRRKVLRRLFQAPLRVELWLNYSRQRVVIAGRNLLRRVRRSRIDYVVMHIGGSLPERDAPPRPFFQRFLPYPADPLSMQVVNARFQRLVNENNIQGVVIHLAGFMTGLATLQNLRQSILRLRASGKTVVVFTSSLSLPNYYVATAADQIIAPPGTTFDVLGLRSEAMFLRDALARLGIAVEVFQISPYKTAANMFGEAGITPEQVEQLDWLLDDNYDQITRDLAAGRGISQDEIKALIDQAPYPAHKAAELNLIDHVAYEDQLAELLASDEQKHARLGTWAQVHKLLLEKARPPASRYIGVISLEGAIAPGSSRRSPVDLPIPFLGGATAGAATMTDLLRRAERMPQMAALILHVDSPGGLATSSDLIWRQVYRLSLRKPVLVYMGNVAASGGYYVSAPAQHIMSQEATVTGSIGVVAGRFNTDGLFDLLQINRTSLTRGARASLYSDSGDLTEEERTVIWDGIVDSYDRFKKIVADGRNLPYGELDPICHGRVWTGRQALEHKLVDSHGDFIAAIKQAAELADLPGDLGSFPTINLSGRGGGYLLPRPFEAPKEWLSWVVRERIIDWNGQPLTLLPYHLHWR